MANLQIDANLPALTPVESLAGCRREFCVELLGDAVARVFVRKVEQSSFKADQLQRGTLFHRLPRRLTRPCARGSLRVTSRVLPPKFADLAGCIEAVGSDLRLLAETAKRTRPSKDNLFAAVLYDRSAWERVKQGVDRWARQPTG